ncbi:33690_t:CDS:2 [Gigaspora margarita]|uniref:33690_t:CDS:1 n=1 Tax=Gigaspora margarita TaxID=4874 RepID=A0ABN7WS80_GIGMA|nr:33690_t:CDS:2 [Gigaspora margarita]
MGRDEKIWGEDAKEYNPKRFLNSEDDLRPNKFKFELVPDQKSPEFKNGITLPMKDSLMIKVSYRTKN